MKRQDKFRGTDRRLPFEGAKAEDYISTREIAERLRVDPSRVNYLARKGRLPKPDYTEEGSLSLWLRAAYMAWEESRPERPRLTFKDVICIEDIVKLAGFKNPDELRSLVRRGLFPPPLRAEHGKISWWLRAEVIDWVSRRDLERALAPIAA